MEQEIMNLIVAIAPALSAIIGVIGAIVVMLKKIKQIDDKHEGTTRTLNNRNSELHGKMDTVLSENAELKRQLSKVMKILNHVKNDE